MLQTISPRRARFPRTARPLSLALLVLLLAPYAPATAVEGLPFGAPPVEAGLLEEHADLLPLTDGIALPFTPPPVLDQWVAIPVLQTRLDGAKVPAFLAINVEMRGTTKEAMTDAGIPFVPLLEAPHVPHEEIWKMGIPAQAAEALVDSLPTSGSAAGERSVGASITDADPVRAHVYYDQALMDQGFANEATAAWAVSVNVIARDTGINIWDAYLTTGRVNSVPDDVTSPCHMQLVAFWVEQTFSAGNRGSMINIFSPGEVSVEGGAQGFINDGPLTRPLRWGESIEDCPGTMAPKRSPAYIPQTYVRVDDVTYAHIPGYHDGNLKGTDYLVAHELAHAFEMSHGHAACYTTSGQLWHLHKTIEAYTGGTGTPSACEGNTWPSSHYHWNFNSAGINAMKAERSRWTGCVNAGWCTWGATPAVPTATATPGNGQVQVTVSVAPANGGSSIYEYKVFRGTTSYFMSDSPVGVISGSTGTFTDTGRTNGVTYYYYVRAVNSVGWGPRSDFLAATPAAGATAPGAPTLNSATGGSVYVDLSWTPDSTGGSAITSYKIYRGTCSGCESLYASGVTGTSYRDTGVTAGTTYYYKVAAVNAIGTGPLSNGRSATPLSGPSGPANDNIGSAFVGSGTSWTPASQNAAGATAQTNEQFPCGMGPTTVWYRFTPSSSGTYRFSTVGSGYDTVLALYSSGTLGSASLACNDDAVGVQSQLDRALTGGVAYWVQIGGYSSTTPGTLQLSIALQGGGGGGTVYVRDDDGTREGTLDVDHYDDAAIKYLNVRDSDHTGAVSARLWVYAEGENCGATGGTHSLYMNGALLLTYDPCTRWSMGAYSWSSFTVPVSSIQHDFDGVLNEFAVYDSGATWTDQGAFFGFDTSDDNGRSYMSSNGGADMFGELMWYLEITK